MIPIRDAPSQNQRHALDVTQWVAQLRAELERLIVIGCDVGQLEAVIEKRIWSEAA